MALFKAFHTLHFLYSSRFRIRFVLENIPNFNDMKIPSKKVSVKNLKKNEENGKGQKVEILWGHKGQERIVTCMHAPHPTHTTQPARARLTTTCWKKPQDKDASQVNGEIDCSTYTDGAGGGGEGELPLGGERLAPRLKKRAP